MEATRNIKGDIVTREFGCRTIRREFRKPTGITAAIEVAETLEGYEISIESYGVPHSANSLPREDADAARTHFRLWQETFIDCGFDRVR